MSTLKARVPCPKCSEEETNGHICQNCGFQFKAEKSETKVPVFDFTDADDEARGALGRTPPPMIYH